MQITVFGASGNIGRRVVALALEQGYSVVACTHRTPLPLEHDGLKTVVVDISSADEVSRAIAGSDAVISCLGSWHTKSKDVLTVAMQSIIPAMEVQGVTRIISLTGAGAFDEPDVITFDQKISHFMMSLAAGKVLSDGEQHLRLLRASKLDWTVIRSPVMNNRGGDAYMLSMKLPNILATINKQAVATCMVAQIVSKDFIRQAPIIYRA